jgi:hypothetical protein
VESRAAAEPSGLRRTPVYQALVAKGPELGDQNQGEPSIPPFARGIGGRQRKTHLKQSSEGFRIQHRPSSLSEGDFLI